MKEETKRKCDVCGSINISWYSCDDKNHLCVEHRANQTKFSCGRDV